MIRKAAAAGQFYDASCSEIEKQIDHFNAILDRHLSPKELEAKRARMIISPHAGYVYSGFTANVAHRILGRSKAKRAIVIGPSHRVYIKGASISLHESYQSVCGTLKMDRPYALKLQESFHLLFQENAHHEHSTETQIPFIQHYLPQIEVCEIVYGDISFQSLAKLIDRVLEDEANVVVISTDLSHFFTQTEAKKLDSSCLHAIKDLDNEMMQNGICEACGKTGVMAAIEAAKKHNLQAEILDYRTSADASQDTSSVVGYTSALFF